MHVMHVYVVHHLFHLNYSFFFLEISNSTFGEISHIQNIEYQWHRISKVSGFRVLVSVVLWAPSCLLPYLGMPIYGEPRVKVLGVF